MTDGSQILSVEQMYEADRLAIKTGIPGLELMENAGQGVAAHIEDGWDPCSVLVLCGPGNNGGDGYVIARALSESGWPVAVSVFGDPQKLSGDAKEMYEQYQGTVGSLSAARITGTDLIVDAVFGAGFKGDLPADLQSFFKRATSAQIPIVAVDVPSGVNGTSGEVAVGTPLANLTVSFFRAKTGHLFYPARSHIGLLEIIDIGIPETVLDDMDVQSFENDPDLWRRAMPVLAPTGHKYSRGHGAVVGGGVSHTGAARIAAKAALRSGAGAVTVVSPPSALLPYSIALEAVMVKAAEDEAVFQSWLEDRRIGAVLIGPGNGVTARTRAFVISALELDCTVILDADALTVFQDDPEILFGLIQKKRQGHVVLTPHEAEFSRLFDVKGSAVERCRSAADLSGAIVLLKGASTVIAEPKGRTAVNIHAPPWLATAGSGDALAGILTGLVTGGGDVFLAASAAVWLHGEAAYSFGPGLIAEDIESQLPSILTYLNT